MKTSVTPLRSDRDKTYYKTVFYFISGVFAASFFILLLTTGGYAARGILFASREQTFMDFFNSLLSTSKNPYENYSFYPPFAMLCYKLLLYMVPGKVLDRVIVSRSATSFSPDAKLFQQLYFPFILYSLLTVILLFFALKSAKSGKTAERVAFIFLAFTSAPMLFMLERANNIIIPLFLLIYFVKQKDSERRLNRELALAALGVAAAFKIYPILFCALLLHEKRIKDILKVAAYFLVLSIPPIFIFFGGIGSFRMIVENLAIYGDKHGLAIGSQLNFAKTVIFPFTYSTVSSDLLLRIGQAFKVTVTLFASVGAVFARKEWQRAALVCCIIYGYPAACSTYLLTFFLIPIMLLLDTEKENSPVSYASLVLMTLTQILLVVPNPLTGAFTRDVPTKVTSYAIILLTVLLSAKGCLDAADAAAQHLKVRKSVCIFAEILLTAGVLAVVLLLGRSSVFGLVKIPGLSGLLVNLIFCGGLLLALVILAAIRYTVVRRKKL
ncbi:MAG: DUF2029 domain-containing protein [Clostridia bacterium]|nr:DUF2029 domain-containing protein [Clostridia bacterium]